MRKRKLLSLLFLLSFISGCSKTEKQFDIISQELNSSPYDALCELRSMDIRRLPSRLRARHALLSSIAADKSYIDIEDDSIISVASSYYLRHGSPEDKATSLYYHGLVNKNAGDLSSAILRFEEAQKCAEKAGNHHLLGLICRNRSEIYDALTDYPSELDDIESAVDNFNIAGDTLYSLYMLFNLANCYTMLDKGKDAQKTYDSLLVLSAGNDVLLSETYMRYSMFEMSQSKKRPLAAVEYGEKVDDSLVSCPVGFYADMGLAYDMLGDKDKSDTYFQFAEGKVVNSYDRVRLLYRRFEREKMLDKASSLPLIERYAFLQDSIFLSNIANNATQTLKNYYKGETDRMEAAMNSRRNMTILASLLGLFFFIAVLLAIRLFYRERLSQEKKRTDKEMRKAIELSEDLRLTQQDNNKMAALVGEVIGDQIIALGKLASSYFKMEDEKLEEKELNKKDKKVEDIVIEYRSELRKLRNEDKWFEDLVKAINISENGLVDRFYADFMDNVTTGLSMDSQDLKIVPMMFAGFPIKIICFVTGLSESAVRMRKTRYKEKFYRLGNANTEEYVSRLYRES